MTVRSRITKFFVGKWTENRLMSRKWWLAAGVIGSAVVADFVGRPFADSTVSLITGIGVPWLTLQSFADIYRIKQGLNNMGGDV